MKKYCYKKIYRAFKTQHMLSVLFCGLLFLATLTNAEPHVQNSIEDQKPELWLKKMQLASMQENYQGTFMFTRGDMSSSMSIVHRYQDGEEQELLKQLDGEMGEIVRQGSEVRCVFPDNRVVQLEKAKYSNKIVQSFSNFMPDQKNYRLQHLGECRQVNRPCIKLAIKAVDKHRYSYFLWLDKQTGLLLRSDLKNHEGTDLERFQYTNISFPEQISDNALAPMNAGALVEHVMIPSVQKDIAWPLALKWESNWNPPGFMPISSHLQNDENVLIFSDGLANYSIFIEKITKNGMPEGASQVGATVAYAQSLSHKSHEYSVTVIGEIPAMTAMLVAESVKPVM